MDGINTQLIDREVLRSSIAIVPQEPLLLKAATIRENLDIENIHNDAEIWRALDQCHVQDLVEGLPDKLDCLDASAFLSRGELQLLALSRAVCESAE